jgi:hypothetical protein
MLRYIFQKVSGDLTKEEIEKIIRKKYRDVEVISDVALSDNDILVTGTPSGIDRLTAQLGPLGWSGTVRHRKPPTGRHLRHG